MLNYIIAFGLPIVIFAVAYNQCFWTNFLNALNIILCSAIAFNYAQPLANLINEQAPAWSGFTEFLCIWVLFVVTFLVSKTICNLLSKYPVRFGKKLDEAFDWVGCILVTLVLQCWIAFTLFAAPVGEENFSTMMRSGLVSSEGRIYGQVVFGLPSRMGLGGQPFDMDRWATTRLERARDEANHPS